MGIYEASAGVLDVHPFRKRASVYESLTEINLETPGSSIVTP